MTLEDFMRQYIRNAAIENQKTDSYADYILKNGTDPAPVYADTLKNAITVYEKSLPTYGEAAEKLGRGGMAGSGYGAYLEEAAGEIMRSAEETAAKQAEAGARKNRSDYAAYLEGEREKAETLRKQVASSIGNKKIFDADTAYQYAVISGLGDSDAAATATVATAVARDEKKKEVTERAIRYGLGYQAAYRYAVACGLDGEAAEMIAEASEAARKEKNSASIYTIE